MSGERDWQPAVNARAVASESGRSAEAARTGRIRWAGWARVRFIIILSWKTGGAPKAEEPALNALGPTDGAKDARRGEVF